ncbi:MAG: 30S ribosome-binding factor RbfA [Spirochaetales bacterium]|nr:30S ribosome-binding factor RbfA [Spirochaetales bacterium]
MSEYRLKRVENLIREQISGLIMQGVIKDPRVDTLLSVSRVKVSKDFGYADVFISSIRNEKRVDKSVIALNHAAGFIQHKLRGVLHLRNTPVLRFKRDNGIAEGFIMTQKLKELS